MDAWPFLPRVLYLRALLIEIRRLIGFFPRIGRGGNGGATIGRIGWRGWNGGWCQWYMGVIPLCTEMVIRMKYMYVKPQEMIVYYILDRLVW